MPKKRMHSAQRREQIIGATGKLIAQNGLGWATVARIAEAVDITQPALYRHFKNRQDILMATLEYFSEDFLKLIVIKDDVDVVEALHDIALVFTESSRQNPERGRIMFEFICAPPEDELRDAVKERFNMLVEQLKLLLKRGVDQGVFKADLDLSLAAWEIFSLGFTLNFVIMMGMDYNLSEEKALKAVEDIMLSIKL